MLQVQSRPLVEPIAREEDWVSTEALDPSEEGRCHAEKWLEHQSAAQLTPPGTLSDGQHARAGSNQTCSIQTQRKVIRTPIGEVARVRKKQSNEAQLGEWNSCCSAQVTRTWPTADMQWQKSDSLIHPLGLPTAQNSNGQQFTDLGSPLYLSFVDHLLH